jgi:hypothetical protein
MDGAGEDWRDKEAKLWLDKSRRIIEVKGEKKLLDVF